VVVGDSESALLFSNVPSNQRDRHIDINKQPARRTMNVIMSIDSGIVPARLISECEFLNLSVPGQQVQCPINRAVCHAWIALPDTLEDLAGREVRFRFLHDRENHCALSCFSIPSFCLHIRSGFGNFAYLR
jgi:hypothetical protein